MAEHAPTRPKQDLHRIPYIEKKHGRSIGHWQQIIADCGLDKHMAIAGYLKAEHGMGHRHANAFAGRALAGNPPVPETPQVPPQDRQPCNYHERPAHVAA